MLCLWLIILIYCTVQILYWQHTVPNFWASFLWHFKCESYNRDILELTCSDVFFKEEKKTFISRNKIKSTYISTGMESWQQSGKISWQQSRKISWQEPGKISWQQSRKISWQQWRKISWQQLGKISGQQSRKISWQQSGKISWQQSGKISWQQWRKISWQQSEKISWPQSGKISWQQSGENSMLLSVGDLTSSFTGLTRSWTPSSTWSPL